MSHKAGFVNIVGKPNVGKSTLINQLMGEKLSIVTSKAQTTRHRILGIWNDENTQIVFSDTPGIISRPAYELQEAMNRLVKESLLDADIIMFITELGEEKTYSEFLIQKLKEFKGPILVLLNKIDLSKKTKDISDSVEFWHQIIPEAEILPISAKHGFNTELIIDKIKTLLPEAKPYYEKDQFTDKPQRFFVNEAIREKILENYQQEIPYSVEVSTENFKEDDTKIIIDSIIYVERESQKGIIIGHGGNMLKTVGTEARKELEKFFGKKIHLNIFVKVRKDWRSNNGDLKDFGYQS